MPNISMFTVEAQIAEFQKLFSNEGDKERAKKQKAYIKSPYDFFGVSMPVIRNTAKTFQKKHPKLERIEYLALIKSLWNIQSHDFRSLGIALLEGYRTSLQEEDLLVIEKYLQDSQTWDHIDWLSTKISGFLVERYPKTKKRLKLWSQEENFWMRRASMLSLLDALRAGKGDFTLFSQFASKMIEEKEFFIRKAIGWILREVSKKRPNLSFHFLLKHIQQVSGLTLREGSKYLSQEQKENLERLRQKKTN